MNFSGFKSWRAGRSVADRIVTSPLVRWIWSGLTPDNYSAALTEYRPTDRESVREMMNGRYLLASKLIDTMGVSPFAFKVDHAAWHAELHGFSWLRHFPDARGEDERRFARTLVLDWIGNNSAFDPETWGLALTTQRVMNWLRHYSLLTQGASDDQVRTISRSISIQIQSVRLRGPLASEPLDGLMAAILVCAATLCDESASEQVGVAVAKLCAALGEHIDDDGMHNSRNSRTQIVLLTELVSLRQTLSQRSHELVRPLGVIMDRMHLALDSLTLGTGEPAYFNGCGQQQVELTIAVQTQANARRRGNALVAGYGIIQDHESVVILDSGRVPEPVYATDAHASALAFEFSQGNELIVGNCGPAPSELSQNKDLFREGSAHSGPTIEDESAARLDRVGVLHSFGDKPFIEVSKSDPTLTARTSGYKSRYGAQIERRLTLMAEGQTLVGQDRLIVPGGRQRLTGNLVLRFHLAQGAQADRSRSGEVVRIRYPSGKVWSFLWEAAEVHLEESVRQSAHIGFYHTQQIVLETALAPNAEISWIFTQQS